MCKKEISKEVIEEWKRFIASDEFQHDPECGTLLIAQHFAEWQKRQMMKDAVEGEICDSLVGDFFVYSEEEFIETWSKFEVGDKVQIIVVKKDK